MEPELSSIGSTDCAQLRGGLPRFFCWAFLRDSRERVPFLTFFAPIWRKSMWERRITFSLAMYLYGIRSFVHILYGALFFPPARQVKAIPGIRSNIAGRGREGEDAVMVVHGRCGGEREGKED